MTQWLVRRGLLATVPVASLVLAFGACSSEPGEPAAPLEDASELQTSDARELIGTAAAGERLARLNKQFARTVKVAPKDEPTPAKLAQGLRGPAGRQPATDLVSESRPVISAGDADRFLLEGDRIRVEVSARKKVGAIRPSTIELPHRADGFVRVQPDNSPIAIEFATRGAKPRVAAEMADGVVTYPGAAPGGGDIVLRVTSDAVEDFVVLNKKPEQAFVDYAVNVSDVAGLRLYANTLEFLGSDGDPQIRVRPPELVDALGKGHPARLEIQGCAFDTSEQLPWDRPVTAPGASECTIRVAWDDAKVEYPAIVDPVWQTAGSLATARHRNAATRLANGFVLTCGGLNIDGDAVASCEVFNPGAAAGAGSWAAGASLNTPRSRFMLLTLGSDVLAVGDSSSYTSELLSGGVWTPTATNFSAGYGYIYPLHAVVTSDNAWVVMVDYQGRPFRYSVTAKAWTIGTSNNSSRDASIIVPAPAQGHILRCGGVSGSTLLKTCERYNPTLNSWASPGAAADTNANRYYSAWAQIDASRVMLYGGYNPNNGIYINSAEIYNGLTNTWTNTGSIINSVYESGQHTTWALHVGSGRIFSTASNFQVFSPTAATWSSVNNYDGSNYFYSLGTDGAVASAGNRVLVVPVSPNGASGPQTACKLFDLGVKGATCSATAECQDGLTCSYDWNDGVSVCCDTDCSVNRCNACRGVNKASGTGDGTCGPRKTQQYVGYDFCPSTSSSTCGTTGGYCDGAGACEKWSSSYSCGASSCVDSDTQNNTRYCDGQGACAPQTTTNCTTGYKCLDSQCYTYCNSDDYCASDYYCNFWEPPYSNCTAKKANGQTCNSTSQCQTGNCVDGYCCDDACDGLCEACSNTLTGQTNGACKPIAVAAGYQFNDCYDAGASSCGQTGACDGAGACQLYANGTQCADVGVCASETSRYIPDTCNGTGTCVDKSTANCAAGYSCQGGSCNTECTSDANCASNFWCDVTNKVCVQDRTQGQSCARDAVCSGNANCVDGVCCDSSCSGSCRSCLKARTGLASDGLCSNILDDTDPENECTTGAAYPNSCAAPGLCNGAGACRPYAKTGIECDTDVCTDSTLTTYECNGAGTCKAQAQQCYPFKCDTTNNVCRVACSLDAHCVDGSACENGTCVGQLANGEACTRGPQCSTGFCANVGEGVLQGDETGAGGDGAGGAAGDPGTDSPGVCCDEACQGTCSGCKASIKGFGSDGICEFVKNNTDPANDCEKAVGDQCGLDGQCNGSGACRLAPTGTSCGATSCQGNSLLGQSCNGQGDCINDSSTDCGAFKCGEVNGVFECNSCTDDNNCSDGYFCEDSTCLKKLANGKACTTSGICSSGYCIDGLCCDASCNGQCEACDSPGNEGICSPVQGEPHGARAKCDHAGEECGGACDGVNAAACRYAATGTTCGEASCNNGLANSSVCNGQGECRANAEAECSPYVCGEDETCLSRCEIDADCSQGYACDETTQRCLPSVVSAECSEDRQSSVGQNGISTPCKPFLCVPASGTCAVSCAATTDCSPEFVCEASTKTCLPAPPDGGLGEEEGCACRAAGASTPSSSYHLALVALGLALTGLRRRKRFTKSPARASKPARFESGPHLSE